jgi:hypothetical protein
MQEHKMKRLFAMMLVAVLTFSSGIAFASSPTAAVETVKETSSAVAIESNIEKIQQSFSGLVKKTDNGLILETADGTYQLKGLSLDEIIGKEVYVTGVVKSDQEENTIYVVKADVKE